MIDEYLLKMNPVYNIWDEQMGRYIDLWVWFFLQNHYMPNYIIGKHDEWKDWVGCSLNGLKTISSRP